MITVVDAPCGAGKTEWAISYMNEHPQEQFIFVTPFLSEVDRIKKGTKETFYEPQHFNRSDLLGGDNRSKTKLEDFNDLLENGYNVVTTHTTFGNTTRETVNILQNNSYHLIIDEAVEVILPFDDVLNPSGHRFNGKDAEHLIDNQLITVDDSFHVQWTGVPQPLEKNNSEKYSYYEIQRHAQNGDLLLIDKKCFLWEFPPDIFRAMKSTTILTYQMEGSFFYPYMQIHHFEYNKASVKGSYETGFELIPFTLALLYSK